MIKIKNYLVIIILLSLQNSFAEKVIRIAKDNDQHRIVLNVTNTQLPSKEIPKNSKPIPYAAMDLADEKIAQHCWKKNEWKDHISLFNYKVARTFDKNSHYSVYRCLTTHAKEYLYYSFSWKKKPYNKLKGFEKQLADYYNANGSSEIEFLYAWKHYEADPWAIKVNGTMHATIWVQAQAVNKIAGQKPNSFLDVSYKDERKNINILINEKDHVVAKRIDHIITFNNKN